MRAKTCIDGSNPSVSAKSKRPQGAVLGADATVDGASRFDEAAQRPKDIGGAADGGPGAQRRDEAKPSNPSVSASTNAPFGGVCILDTASRLEHTQSRDGPPAVE